MNKIKVGIVFISGYKNIEENVFNIHKFLDHYHFIYLQSVPEKGTDFVFNYLNSNNEPLLCSHNILKKICIPQSNAESYSEFKFYKPDTEFYLIFDSFKQYTLDKSHYPILDSHILSI